MLKKILSNISKNSGIYTALLAFVVIATFIYSAEAINPTKYATQTGAGTKDGSSWANAMGEAELGSALRNPLIEGEFWIAEGVYRPSTSGNSNESFIIKSDRQIYGGFKGNETSLVQRKVYQHKTIFTGDLNNDDLYKENGITLSATNIVGTNSKNIMRCSDASDTAIVDGLFITAANNTGEGGGILIEGGSPIIRNCSFIGNKAGAGGAAIAITSALSGPIVSECLFENNTVSAGNGGAILTKASSGTPKIINSTFFNNSVVAGSGGAVYFDYSTTAVVNSTFANNSVSTSGGAVNINYGSVSMVNSIVWGNIQAESEKQIKALGGTPTVSYCVVGDDYVGGTNIITTDPELGYIQYNGGPSRSCLIGSSASARSSGLLSAAPATDQRGITRTSPVDIGAIEYSSTANGVYITLSKANLKVGETAVVNAIVLPGEVSGGVSLSSGTPGVATISGSTVTAVSAGTSVITASYGAFSETCEVTVTKITPEIFSLPMPSPIIYGQKLSSSTLSGGFASVPGSFSWASPNTIPSVADSNITEYEVIFTPTNSTKYSTITGNITVSVSKAATSIITAPSAANLTYGQYLSDSALSGGSASVSGSFAWEFPEIAPDATTGGTATEFFVVFTPNDTVNYNISKIQIPVTVAKASSSVVVPPVASVITYGQTLADSSFSGGTANVPGTFSWSNPTVAPSVSDSGVTSYNVTFTPSDTNNYYSSSTTVKLTVNKAPTNVITRPNVTAITYEQTLASSSFSGGSASVSGVFSWVNSTIVPTVADSLLTEYNVTFTPTDQANYLTSSTVVLIKVDRAETIYSSSGYTDDYDGIGHSISVSVSAPASGYTIKYGVASGVYNLDTPPVYTNAGNNRTYFEITSPNHTTVIGSENVSIRMINPSITTLPSASAITYGQTLVNSVLSGGSGSVGGSFSWGNQTISPVVADSQLTLYNVVFAPTDSVNYNSISGSVKLTVNRAETLYTANEYVGDYDRSSHGISVTVQQPTTGSTVMYGNEPGVYPLGESPAYIAAGERTVYFKITSPNHTEIEGNALITINKATPTIQLNPRASDIVYGERLSQSTLSGGTASVDGNFVWTNPTTIPEVSDSGVTEFPITFQPTDSSNYNNKSSVIMLTISNARTVYDAIGYAGVYDGNPHTITVSVTEPSSGYTLKYGTVSGVYNLDTPPVFTTAGTHTVFFNIKSSNYTEIIDSRIVSIEKEEPQIIGIPSTSEITYGGELGNSVLSGGYATVPGSFSWKIPGVKPAVSDSETTNYTIVFTPEDTENYKNVECSNTVVVNKANMIYNPVDYNGTYDVSFHGISVSVTTPVSGAVIKYGIEAGSYPDYTSPTFAEAGLHAVYFKITADNYNAEEGVAYVNISKATPVITGQPTASDIIYGQTLGDSYLTNGIATVGGTFAWQDTAIKPAVSDSQTTNYAVIFTPHDTVNYNTVTFNKKVKVTGASISFNSDSYSGIYYGLEHTVAVSVTSPATGTLIKYGTTEGTYNLDTAPLFTNVGNHTVYFEITATNYISERSSSAVVISKATPQITVVPSVSAITYGQTLADSTITGGTTSVPGTFSWTEPSTQPLVSNSGIFNYSLTFTPEDTVNYANVTCSTVITVNRAQTIYEALGYTGLYDRNQHTISVTVTTPSEGVTVKYGIAPDTYTDFNAPTYIESGEYTVYFEITSPNHTREVGSRVVKINKAATTITSLPDASAITYGENLSYSMLSGGSGSVPGSFAWLTTSIKPAVSDSTTTGYTVVFTPYDTNNYETKTGVVRLVVGRANISYSADGYEGVYNGSSHSIVLHVTTPAGAQVRYGVISGTCDLLTPPSFREVGSHNTYFTIEDPNFNTATGNALVKILPIESPVVVTAETATDSENSGTLTVGKNTVEDFKIYDAMQLLADTGTLADGIVPASSDAIAAVSADITTSVEIFSKAEIEDSINRYWHITETSRDIALTVSMQNTVGVDAAYIEADGNIFAKAFRFITELFTGRTGETPQDSDYLPLEINMTVTPDEINNLPDDIKNGLSEHNFLERISVFAIAHGDGKAEARKVTEVVTAEKLPYYTSVVSLPDGGYKVKTRFMVFNMPGTVENGKGAPFIQPLDILNSGSIRNGSYYIFQDGIRDGYYDICTVLAVKTLKGRLNITINGDLPPASADWTLTGTAHPTPVSYIGTQTVQLEQDSWEVHFPAKDRYNLTINGEASRSIRWGDTWDLSAQYSKINVTGISSDILPEEPKNIRFNKIDERTRQLHAEVTPADAFDTEIIWTSSDSAKLSVDSNGLVTARALTDAETIVYITATTHDGGFFTRQPFKVTNVVTSVNITEAITVRIGLDPVAITSEVLPIDATNRNINWSSADPSVASVNDAGVVTGIRAGSTVITAAAADGDGSPACVDTCVVTVLPAIIHVTEVAISPTTLTLNNGGSSTLRAVITPETATDKSVTWSSSNEGVVTVSSAGKINALSAGSATITATSTDGAKTGTCAVTVNKIPEPITPILPSDTPDEIRREVKTATAEFTDNKDDVLDKMADNIIKPENLTVNPETKFIEVNGDLAVKLLNDRDIYKTIDVADLTKLPVFAAEVESGKTAAVAFKFKGSEFFATTPDKVKVMKIFSDTESDFFSYAASSALFADGRYTIQTSTDPLYTGAIEADVEYILVLFVKDGGRFDLDKTINGEIIDPSVIVKTEKKDPPVPPTPPTPGPDDGGGGCNASFPLQLLFLTIPFVFKKIK